MLSVQPAIGCGVPQLPRSSKDPYHIEVAPLKVFFNSNVQSPAPESPAAVTSNEAEYVPANEVLQLLGNRPMPLYPSVELYPPNSMHVPLGSHIPTIKSEGKFPPLMGVKSKSTLTVSKPLAMPPFQTKTWVSNGPSVSVSNAMSKAQAHAGPSNTQLPSSSDAPAEKLHADGSVQPGTGNSKMHEPSL